MNQNNYNLKLLSGQLAMVLEALESYIRKANYYSNWASKEQFYSRTASVYKISLEVAEGGFFSQFSVASTLFFNAEKYRNSCREIQKEGIYNPQTEKVGFWKRLGQKLGLVKSTSQSSELAVIKEQKIRLKMELEAANEELKKAILGLSVSKQKEQQYQLLEQEFHQGNKKITVNKVAEEMDE